MKASLGVSFLFAFALFGCSDATGALVGGDPLTATSSSSSGGSGSSSGGGDGGLTYATGLSAACLPGGAQGGNTWSDLYACYFGPSPAVASCATATCHLASGDPGASISGYQCSADKTQCYTSIKSVLVGSNTSSPTSTTLYQVIRKSVPSSPCTVTGAFFCDMMPIGTFTFGTGDTARIAAWIQSGANND